jgi:type I restriction enzyme, S subunit
MGLIQRRNFSTFASEPSVRFDFNYMKSVIPTTEEYYTYKSLFEVVPSTVPTLNESEPFKYAEIGHVSKNGEVFPVTLSFEDRDELNEDLFKKIEKGDIFLPERGNILISAIRPYLNKIVLIEDEDETDIYFTKAFIQIKPLINSRILYYALRTIFSEKINAVSRQGKGYPTLKDEDLKTIQFSKKVIDNLLAKEEELISNIDALEKDIKELKSIQRSKKEIVDEVFSSHFNINMVELMALDNQRRVDVGLSRISSLNSTIRYSYRWNKMKLIQKYLYRDIDCIERLGKYILSSNNGWSPESVVGGEGIPILGQEHFEFDGVLNVSPTKATTKTKSNMENFFIQEGDLFVSRGNTVDLVGLACVVETEVTEDIIYPDLYIRLKINEEVIYKKYLALLFNSFFGRLYFKYVSKGKNQTMVKISSSELLNYYLPIPPMEEQLEIVDKIEKQIDAQNEIAKQIEEKRNQIRIIIEEAARS